MDSLTLRGLAVQELGAVIASIDDSQLETVTNCEPWTVRRLASHALNVQLFWAGTVTGESLVELEDMMNAVAHEGDLGAFARTVAELTEERWARPGVLTSIHPTPFGERPGSAIIGFPTWDATIHSWDLSQALGHACELNGDRLSATTALFEAVTGLAASVGLTQPGTEPPADATETERLMAAAGRTISR